MDDQKEGARAASPYMAGLAGVNTLREAEDRILAGHILDGDTIATWLGDVTDKIRLRIGLGSRRDANGDFVQSADECAQRIADALLGLDHEVTTLGPLKPGTGRLRVEHRGDFYGVDLTIAAPRYAEAVAS